MRAFLGCLFALFISCAQAQVTPGTSPLTIPKGGTGASTAPGAVINLGAAPNIYTAPFTGGVAQTQAAYNALRPSVMDFGAKCNGTGVTVTASITSGNNALTAVGGSFASADVGKSISVGGAGSAGAPLITTISGFTDATHVSLTANAATTLSAVASTVIEYGTDDTVALQAAANLGRPVEIPGGVSTCIINGTITFSISSGGFVGGAGWDSSQINNLSLSAPTINVNNNVVNLTFKNLSLFRTSAAVTFLTGGAQGLNFAGDTEETVIEFVHTRWNNIGILLGTTGYSSATNLWSERNLSHGIVMGDSVGNAGFQWVFNNVLAQLSGGFGILVSTGNNGGSVQDTLETWFDIVTFANSSGGIMVLGTAANPIQNFRLVGAFLGQDGGDEIKLDTHDTGAPGFMLVNVFAELAGTSNTGPKFTTAPSGTGNGLNVTANNLGGSVQQFFANGNSQNGITTSGTSFTQIGGGSSFNSNGGWGILAADGSKVSVNGVRNLSNTSGDCSFTSNANSSIGFGNIPAASTCNSLNNTTASTSKTTGALVTGGGLGVGGNAYIGGALSLSGQGVPTIASGACGTGTNGVVTSGTNQAGLITIGAVATTTCTISFSATLSTAPAACVLFPQNAAAAATGTTVARVSSISTANWVITGTALASTAYYYHCV